jgi:tetratricopeptide (TPR) repeat protein
MLALYALGRLYRQEEDWPHALRTFEKVLALQPTDAATLASLHFYIGTLLPKVRGLEVPVLSQAIDHFSAGLAYQPAWENLLYNRGTLYLGRALLSQEDEADLAAAIADLSAVIERQPQRIDPLLNRGIAYYERNGPGDAAAAAADFGRAIELAPGDFRGYYHRGLLKIRTGAVDWAADLLAAAKRQTQEPAIQNGLCWGHALDGDAAAALPYCERAVAGDSTGSSYDGRAMAYSQLGRYAEAAADLQHYLDWVQAERPTLYVKMHGPEAEAWIAALQAEQNPFTAQVRAGLR